MIQLQKLTKEYKTQSGTIRALDTLTLAISRGQRIGVLGSNGAGKSTLIRLVGRVEVPTSGRVTRSMSVSWPIAFRGGFHNHQSGYDNLRFLSRIYAKPFDEMCAFVEDFTELGGRLRDPVNTYSSGMLAKLSFGVSLAIEFDCYLVDEIVAVGDQDFRKKCRAELFEKRRDRALIMVSHQPGTIEQSCESAILLKDGRHIDTFDVKADRSWRKHLHED